MIIVLYTDILFSSLLMLVMSLIESPCSLFDWALTVPRGQRINFIVFSCPLVGYGFCFLCHISAHVPLLGSFIRGIVGFSLFTSSLLFRRHHCCISLALLSFLAVPEHSSCRCPSRESRTRTKCQRRRALTWRPAGCRRSSNKPI
jgi:hypothetical protein